MNRVLAGVGVVVAAAIAGFSFSPVFGYAGLLVPVAVVAAATFAADLVTRTRGGAVRAPLALLLAVLALVPTVLRATTQSGVLPTAATWSTLYEGTVHGWVRVLDSTWPARPDPDTVLFVPVLVLAAAVLGLEFLRREVSALAALLPATLVLGLGQCFRVAEGGAAIVLVAAFSVAAGVVLATSRPERTSTTASRVRVLPVLATVVSLVAGLAVFGAVDPVGRPPYSVASDHQTPQVVSSVVNPLTEVGARLSTPDTVAFTARTGASADRWTLAVLDRFDGSTWSTSARFRDLGSDLAPASGTTVPVQRRHADIEVDSVPGAWLPTQSRTREVHGTAPVVDPDTGTLLSTTATPGLRYAMDWDAPEVPPEALSRATIAPIEASTGGVPADLVALAKDATKGLGASVRSALTLETWFRQQYKVADGTDIPTGHGYAQLQFFLLESKRGTSEQFASAYAVLARAVNIPSRVAVGFRQPEDESDGIHVVRNADVFAWPEVLVSGIGWIPLDPTGATAGTGDDSIAKAIEKARSTTVDPATEPKAQLTDPLPPPLPPPPPPLPDPLVQWILVGVLVVLLVAMVVPVVKSVRARRRRHPSAMPEAVVGAWLEARDRLRDQGVRVRRGMTVRDVAHLVWPQHPAAAEPLLALTRTVDVAVWSGRTVTSATVAEAWAAADAVRRTVAGKSFGSRVRDLFSVRGLRPLDS
ncbi:transglutaminaseTgpA domain-containing protein [Actinokineospora sp. NBRC 105648]|uniref:transglutaminase TgpA family protein n=1 Tax=Actinokineospora sp. NBRC 105648 TaxID=3032206 RepID=UPI0024A556E5|nr:transglutaminaseTgpA domain-containing protein [Actinokineospora sp. NBRC 105648]GLZ40599.1 hypothetical protein Acsp05_42230 [Actinokineospora sp. NBRC 105648]